MPEYIMFMSKPGETQDFSLLLGAIAANSRHLRTNYTGGIIENREELDFFFDGDAGASRHIIPKLRQGPVYAIRAQILGKPPVREFREDLRNIRESGLNHGRYTLL